MEDLKKFEAVWPEEVRAIRASIPGDRARENRELKGALATAIRETKKHLRGEESRRPVVRSPAYREPELTTRCCHRHRDDEERKRRLLPKMQLKAGAHS
jgi:hypothetical protein